MRSTLGSYSFSHILPIFSREFFPNLENILQKIMEEKKKERKRENLKYQPLSGNFFCLLLSSSIFFFPFITSFIGGLFLSLSSSFLCLTSFFPKNDSVTRKMKILREEKEREEKERSRKQDFLDFKTIEVNDHHHRFVFDKSGKSF